MRCRTEDGDEDISILEYDGQAANAAPAQAIENGHHWLKILRHPCILKYEWEQHISQTTTSVIVEAVVPLVQHAAALTSHELLLGLYDMVQAIAFLHKVSLPIYILSTFISWFSVSCNMATSRPRRSFSQREMDVCASEPLSSATQRAPARAGGLLWCVHTLASMYTHASFSDFCCRAQRVSNCSILLQSRLYVQYMARLLLSRFSSISLPFRLRTHILAFMFLFLMC